MPAVFPHLIVTLKKSNSELSSFVGNFIVDFQKVLEAMCV